MSFIRYTENFGRCMELIGAVFKTDNIANLKKHLDKAELKNICHDIDE